MTVYAGQVWFGALTARLQQPRPPCPKFHPQYEQRRISKIPRPRRCSRGTGPFEPDPDHSVYVDRRFRALPLGGEITQRALAVSAGRFAHHDFVRAAARLHAGRAQGHRLGSAARAAAVVAIRHIEHAAARRALWHRAGDAAHLEIGAGSISRRHSATRRLRRRGALFSAQRSALGRAQARAHDRSHGGFGVSQRRAAAASLAAAGTGSAGGGNRGISRALALAAGWTPRGRA